MNYLSRKIRSFFHLLGPGFITGASDDDPSGIATYSQTGALFGLRQLFLPLYVAPFATVVQEICGRIGLVSGTGLSAIIKHHYSKTILYFVVSLLFLANTINIGANLGAMASSLELVTHQPHLLWLVAITLFSLLLEVFVPYRHYVHYLKYLCLTLLAYVFVAAGLKLDWPAILKASVIPQFSTDRLFLLNIVAFFGTTISPYLFFWQTYEEVEEQISHHHRPALSPTNLPQTERTLRHMRADTIFGMLFASLIAYFIIITAASTLHLANISDIQTAAQAAESLRPLAGEYTYILFTLGIIGAGLLGIPVLAASAAYAVSEAFGWKVGLYHRFFQARPFYLVIAAALIFGLLTNLLPIPPFKLLYYSAVLNGLIAPLILFFILRIANNSTVLGIHTNGRLSNLLGYSITAVMFVAGLFLLADFLF